MLSFWHSALHFEHRVAWAYNHQQFARCDERQWPHATDFGVPGVKQILEVCFLGIRLRTSLLCSLCAAAETVF